LKDFVQKISLFGGILAAGTAALLFALEKVFPLRKRRYPLAARLPVNLAMTAVSFLAGSFVSKLVSLRLSYWVEERQFGLANAFRLPAPMKFMLGFLMMDLSFYYWHRLNHEVPLLWRFHNVHHVDPDLDVTTSFRFHVCEVLYSAGFRAAQVLFIGISPITYMVYEVAFTCETAFHHSNLRLPVNAERALGRVLVTPRMHGIHHSWVKEETNSNYSIIFRWWDVLHGTLRLGVPQSEINIGVPAYALPADNTFVGLMRMPFERQRNYWRMPDGGRPSRAVTDPLLMLE